MSPVFDEDSSLDITCGLGVAYLIYKPSSHFSTFNLQHQSLLAFYAIYHGWRDRPSSQQGDKVTIPYANARQHLISSSRVLAVVSLTSEFCAQPVRTTGAANKLLEETDLVVYRSRTPSTRTPSAA
jgi:hypothetical protein